MATSNTIDLTNNGTTQSPLSNASTNNDGPQKRKSNAITKDGDGPAKKRKVVIPAGMMHKFKAAQAPSAAATAAPAPMAHWVPAPITAPVAMTPRARSPVAPAAPMVYFEAPHPPPHPMSNGLYNNNLHNQASFYVLNPSGYPVYNSNLYFGQPMFHNLYQGYMDNQSPGGIVYGGTFHPVNNVAQYQGYPNFELPNSNSYNGYNQAIQYQGQPAFGLSNNNFHNGNYLAMNPAQFQGRSTSWLSNGNLYNSNSQAIDTIQFNKASTGVCENNSNNEMGRTIHPAVEEPANFQEDIRQSITSLVPGEQLNVREDIRQSIASPVPEKQLNIQEDVQQSATCSISEPPSKVQEDLQQSINSAKPDQAMVKKDIPRTHDQSGDFFGDLDFSSDGFGPDCNVGRNTDYYYVD